MKATHSLLKGHSINFAAQEVPHVLGHGIKLATAQAYSFLDAIKQEPHGHLHALLRRFGALAQTRHASAEIRPENRAQTMVGDKQMWVGSKQPNVDLEQQTLTALGPYRFLEGFALIPRDVDNQIRVNQAGIAGVDVQRGILGSDGEHVCVGEHLGKAVHVEIWRCLRERSSGKADGFEGFNHRLQS